MWRILAQQNPSSALEAAFQPVSGYAFLARITDNTGHYQYLPTCKGAAAGVTGAGVAATAYVDLDTTITPMLTTNATGTNGGTSGLGVGQLRVNPVQIVRWAIRPIDTSQSGDAPYAALVSPNKDKYELFRTYVDVAGTITQQPELIAEYAVDLKFSFSADLTVPFNSAARKLTIYGLTDAQNQVVADDVSVNLTAQPELIRSVHFRIATRSSIADRSEMYSMPAANTPQQGVYPTRYCVLVSCTPGQNGWARIRTITSEVATTNLAKLYY
jgi:hypothetical protein